MKTQKILVVLGALLIASISPLTTSCTSIAADTGQDTIPLLAPTDIDTLVGPIALYPDALVSIILPASTCSTDIVLAARYLEANSTQAPVDNQLWDQSVRALAHYPEVLQWMDQNLSWTQQLGAVFLTQSADVMNSMQRLRAQAQNVGNLATTPQQTIINENNYIRIIPTYDDCIYAPYYDPLVVYFRPFIFRWSPAWICGSWLAYDCNWTYRNIWIGSWSPRYYRAPAWRAVNNRPPPPQYFSRHTWQPDRNRPPVRPSMATPSHGNIVRPAQFGNAAAPGHGPNTTTPGRTNLSHPPTQGTPQNSQQPARPATQTNTTGKQNNLRQNQSGQNQPNQNQSAQTPPKQNTRTHAGTNANTAKQGAKPTTQPPHVTTQPAQNKPPQNLHQNTNTTAQPTTHRQNATIRPPSVQTSDNSHHTPTPNATQQQHTQPPSQPSQPKSTDSAPASPPPAKSQSNNSSSHTDSSPRNSGQSSQSQNTSNGSPPRR